MRLNTIKTIPQTVQMLMKVPIVTPLNTVTTAQNVITVWSKPHDASAYDVVKCWAYNVTKTS